MGDHTNRKQLAHVHDSVDLINK